MTSTPKYPGLYRRGAVYYYRKQIPKELQEAYGKTCETFSLKTKEYPEAVKLYHDAFIEVEKKLEKARLSLSKPVLDSLPDEVIEQIGEKYFTHLLEEDDNQRLIGFDDQEKEPSDFNTPAFEKHADNAEYWLGLESILKGSSASGFEKYAENKTYWLHHTKRQYARAQDLCGFFKTVAGQLLTKDDIDLKLSKKSESWKKLVRILQEATIRANNVISQRNKGEIVKTPVDNNPVYHPDIQNQETKKNEFYSSSSTSLFLSVVSNEWINEKESNEAWTDKTAHAHRAAIDIFIQLNGDKEIGQYTKADAREYKSLLMNLPSNWNKRSNLLKLGNITKAVNKANKLGLPPMSLSNQKKLLRFVSSFFKYALGHYDELELNPFEGISIASSKTQSVKEERLPFTPNELQTIFKNIPDKIKHPGRHWVILIGLYSGMRMGEITQLYATDIKEEKGIFYFDINDDGEGKRLKNKNSKRTIPIHSRLIELGFMDYVDSMKNSKRLFPDISYGSDGSSSSTFSKWFSRFLKLNGIKHNKNCFHSFRHNFEDFCRNNGVDHFIMEAIQGHASSGMAGRYGSGYSIERLKEEIEKIKPLNYQGM